MLTKTCLHVQSTCTYSRARKHCLKLTLDYVKSRDQERGKLSWKTESKIYTTKKPIDL